MTQNNLSLSQQLSKFEAVFCSGFLIPDPAITTALALLFEKVYFLNNLEFVLDFSKKYKFAIPPNAEIPEIKITPVDEGDGDPLSNLTPAQRKTAETYLFLADRFFVKNSRLFPSVFHCTLLPKGEVFTAKLIKEKVDGKKNLYEVTKNSFTVSMEGLDELDRYIEEGKIPILSNVVNHNVKSLASPILASQAAATLALKSIAMVLPTTQKADAETILEAREKLRNHLPSFWSAMLKLSVELQGRLDNNLDPKKLQRECDNAVSTIVKPALIDLVDKMEKDRKLWFHKILSPVSQGLGILVGKPPITPFELAVTSLKLGADIALDVSNQIQKVENLKRETGLTYLIELHKVLSKSQPAQKGSSKKRG
jgi:hypothetical protein